MSAHTQFRKGSPVIVHLKDGSKITGKYEDSTSKVVIIDGGYIPKNKIRQISIRKLKPQDD